MSRSDEALLNDVLAAITAIRGHLDVGTLAEPAVYDAVRMRLIEIGEAVKSISPAVLEEEPHVPWRSVAGMRDRLAHSYFAILVRILAETVTGDLDELESAVARMAARRG